MIRRLIARLRPRTLKRWRKWQHEKFCERLREGDFL